MLKNTLEIKLPASQGEPASIGIVETHGTATTGIPLWTITAEFSLVTKDHGVGHLAPHTGNTASQIVLVSALMH